MTTMILNCPYCRTEVATAEPAAGIKTCEGCGTPHHQECYDENGGCTLFGCKFAPPDEPKLQLNHSEISAALGSPPPVATAQQRQFTGFGDVMAASAISLARANASTVLLSAPPPAVPPPPRMSAGAADVAPPPSVAEAPTVSAPAPEGFISPGGIFDSVMSDQGRLAPRKQPRSRMVYIMLGLFFGIFGIHSFYAGYKKRGALQLCLTIFTFFYGSLITAIWAIVEVCTVDRDSDGVELS